MMPCKRAVLTVRDKFFAMKAMCPSVSLIAHDDGWRVVFPNSHFSTRVDATRFFGHDTDEAINETWFWLTREDYRDVPRMIGPVELPCFIRGWNGVDIWYRWEGFAWLPHVIRKGDGVDGV